MRPASHAVRDCAAHRSIKCAPQLRRGRENHAQRRRARGGHKGLSGRRSRRSDGRGAPVLLEAAGRTPTWSTPSAPKHPEPSASSYYSQRRPEPAHVNRACASIVLASPSLKLADAFILSTDEAWPFAPLAGRGGVRARLREMRPSYYRARPPTATAASHGREMRTATRTGAAIRTAIGWRAPPSRGALPSGPRPRASVRPRGDRKAWRDYHGK